jgi:predicted transcriptional regulator
MTMKALTISLPDALEQQLQEMSRRENRTPQDTVCEIVRRRLVLDRFHDLCRSSEALAKAAGFESDDDVLRAIS